MMKPGSGEDLLNELEKEMEILEKDISNALQIFSNNSTASNERSAYIIYHAFFISVYSFWEESLRRLSYQLAHTSVLQKRVSRFEKVYQYYDFLTNELKIDRDKLVADWGRLDIFREVRNCIVHHHASIGKNISQKAFEYISENPSVNFEEPRVFKIIGKEPILDLLSVSKRFLVTLIDEWKQRCEF